MNNVVKYAGSCIRGTVLRLLAVAIGISTAYAQSPREQVAQSPFTEQALALQKPDIQVRQIAPTVLRSLPSKQTPQAFPPVQYKTSGKEFYVVFLSSVSSDPQGSVPLRRVYVSSRAHVRVKISHVGGSWSQSFETLPRSLTPVTLPSWASLDRLETEAAYKRVFKIEAEDDVAVYALSPNYLSSDGFLVLPKESLGREYVVSSVRNALWYNGGSITPTMGIYPFPRSEFGVAAIEDGTEVTINLTAQSYSKRYQKGFYYKFTLNRGEVIQFMAHDTGRKALVNYLDKVTNTNIPKMSIVGKEIDSSDCDFTGSQVLANKPIAVFSGHERASVPDNYEFAYEGHPEVSRDHLIEQMPPVEVWGKRFLVIASLPGEDQSRPKGGDIVRVIARYNNTLLFVNGIFRDTLNEGEYSQFLSGDFAYIETSQPALAVKYLATADPATSPGTGDPDMTVVPPIENMSTFYSLPTIHLGSYFTEHYITLIIDTAALYTTTLNGLLPDNTAWKALPNLPYMFARYRTQFEGEQRVESSLPCYAETYGYGDVDSYSFSGGGDFHYIRGLTANDLNFGFVRLGDSRDSVTTVLSTIKPSPLADTVTIFRYTWESGDTNVFGLLDTITTPIKLAPGQTLPVTFSFRPKKTGSFTARLRVWSNDFQPVYIKVFGTSGVNYLQVDYNTIDFGRVRVNKALASSFDAYILGDNASGRIKISYPDFDKQIVPHFITQPLADPSLGPIGTSNAGFTRVVTFIPDSEGYFSAVINLANDGAAVDTPAVYLFGRGVAPEVITVDTNFGNVRYETVSPWYKMPIINRGSDFSAIANIDIVKVGDYADFAIQKIPTAQLDTVNAPLNANTVYYQARFEPHYRSQNLVKNDVRFCTVRIVTIDGDTIFATLAGTAVEPWFEASPLAIDFGTIKNPLLSDPGEIKKKFAVRNAGTMLGLLNALTIPAHAPGDDSIYFTVEPQPRSSYGVDVQDSIEVTFYIKNVGVFRDSIVVENDSRRQPLIYLSASVEAEYDLNDSIYLDTVMDCLPIDTVVRIRNPYRIPIYITDTLFTGNVGGFTFSPGVFMPIVIKPGGYFDFTVRFEFPIDSVNGTQELLLITTKPVVLNGVLTSDDDTVHVILYRRMQILDLVAGKLPYNPNAKDAPFRLPIHIRGQRIGKSELDNMTVQLHFSNKLVAPVGIDRTGSLTESTPTNGIPQQPQWTWDEATSTMSIPIKDAKLSSDPSNNTLLFTLLGTTYLTVDTMVEIRPEIAYDQKPCAYRISRDSATVIYADECGDRTIRDLILRNPGFSIGQPYPDPATSDAKTIFIPYVSRQTYAMQWKLYDETGAVLHKSEESSVAEGTGTLAIDRRNAHDSGVYFIEVTVRDPDTGIADRHIVKFVVTD